jgi:hypothetical protein
VKHVYVTADPTTVGYAHDAPSVQVNVAGDNTPLVQVAFTIDGMNPFAHVAVHVPPDAVELPLLHDPPADAFATTGDTHGAGPHVYADGVNAPMLHNRAVGIGASPLPQIPVQLPLFGIVVPCVHPPAGKTLHAFAASSSDALPDAESVGHGAALQ